MCGYLKYFFKIQGLGAGWLVWPALKFDKPITKDVSQFKFEKSGPGAVPSKA
jgi:hypothetical protein